jgi:hypothetical protein
VSQERDYSHRSLLDKLGVKEGHRVSLLGLDDQPFEAQLRSAGADVSRRRRRASDLLFLSVEGPGDLASLATVEPWMTRDGACWVVFPKGRKDLRDVEVIAAGVGAGLVDNKVVRFSDTHTAFRFVIPRARR